jgi:hypothetical protein
VEGGERQRKFGAHGEADDICRGVTFVVEEVDRSERSVRP